MFGLSSNRSQVRRPHQVTLIPVRISAVRASCEVHLACRKGWITAPELERGTLQGRPPRRRSPPWASASSPRPAQVHAGEEREPQARRGGYALASRFGGRVGGDGNALRHVSCHGPRQALHASQFRQQVPRLVQSGWLAASLGSRAPEAMRCWRYGRLERKSPMLKVYEGLVWLEAQSVRYSIDWSCPTCSSSEVQIDPEDTGKLFWCDGGPSTEDQLRLWICRSCGHRANGQNMRSRVFDYVVLLDLNRP